jgi:hypothetical protein
MKNKIILDLDGTLFNIDHRLKYYGTDWDKYDYEIINDIINDDIYTLTWHLDQLSTPIDFIILTGRYEKTKQLTEERLNKSYGWLSYELIMKPNDDHRSSYHFKTEWIKDNKDSILLIVDDRDDILDYCESELNLLTIKSHNK